MSDITYTHEQMNAISLRDKNLLVSAAAGTGKTAVLVERIIRMAADEKNPVGLDRMLVVTFTKAAAAEMKERIRNALFNEIKKNPDNPILRKQIILLNQASISTIHSFCSEVIRSNYHLLDIDPAFTVCETMEGEILLEEALNTVLMRRYETNGESFKKLIDNFGRGKDDGKIVDLIKKLHGFIRSMPEYEKWLHEKAGYFTEKNTDFGRSRWGQLLLAYGKLKIEGYIAETADIIDLIEFREEYNGYYMTLESDMKMFQNSVEVFNDGNWNDCCLVLQDTEFVRLGRIPKNADPLLSETVKNIRNDIKKEYKKLAGIIYGSSKDILENLKEIAPVVKCLADITMELDYEFTTLKNSKGVLDYSDLEHHALKCLESEAGNMYRSRFKEVLVDEYQDSNPIQERIIKLVSGRNKGQNNVFMVGDVKQSIYKFRQAMPELFIEKYQTYSEDINEENVKIELFRNYRSRKPILDFTNYIFSQIMSTETGDIDYNEDVALSPGIEYSEGNDDGYAVEIKLVCGQDKDRFGDDVTKLRKEATVVGNEILKMIDSGMTVTDRNTGEQRRVKFGDITVLMRTIKEPSREFMLQFKRMGIPAFADGGADFFNEREIAVMIAFLEILDNPRQDIPLLTVMHSRMFGFSDNELAIIRLAVINERYYDALHVKTGYEVLDKKVAELLKVLLKFRRISKNTPIDKLIWEIIHDTGYFYNCSEGENIEIKQGNLRRLFEIASTYETSKMTGLFNFLRYIKNHKERSSDLAGTVLLSENENIVKIMSIHKSKGLEFPVVILACCGKKFNTQDSRSSMIFDRELGFGPNYVNAKEGYWFATIPKKCIIVKKVRENLAEELRILYVALTRAREKLVITGYVDNTERELGNWLLRGKRKGNKINPGKVLASNSFLEWVMSCTANHENGHKIYGNTGYSMNNADKNEPLFNIEFIYPSTISEIIHNEKRFEKKQGEELKLSYEDIKSRFEWKYAYEGELDIHKKISVTELKKLKERESGLIDIFVTEFAEKPEFMKDSSDLSAAEKGTLIHNVLAVMDISKGINEDYISGLFRKAGADDKDNHRFTEIITGYCKSDLGKRMASSISVIREKAFLLPLLTEEIYPNRVKKLPDGHSTLIQGIIDCLFFEDDNIVIVDFKTDKVNPGEEELSAKKYEIQINLYTRAVETITGRKVKEKYIYFLQTQKAVMI